MDLITDLGGLTESQLLEHAESVARQQRECEVQLLRVAVQHAIIHNPDRLDPDLTRLPGRERAKRYGGVGTPEVVEFACAELGARLAITSWAAAALMSDGLDLAIRLPLLWTRVERLEVRSSYARHVARRTRDLTIEQAAYVDARVVESADGRIPWTRFEALVEGAVAAGDPWAAELREIEQQRRQCANPTRSDGEGMRGFFVRAPFHVVARLDAAVTRIADILHDLGDPDPVDQRRVKALLVLCDPDRAAELVAAYTQWHAEQQCDQRQAVKPEVPWTDLLPVATVVLHCYSGPEPTDVVRIEGLGPVTERWVAQHLGAARITVTPVLDLDGQAPVDAYEIPDRHRRAVRIMTPADVFPWGSCTTTTQQIDHTEAYRPGVAGQTRLGNYGPMTGFHHRVKTHAAGWQVRQPFPGLYVWRDPHGATYLVDHSGTRRLGATRAPAGRTSGGRPRTTRTRCESASAAR